MKRVRPVAAALLCSLSVFAQPTDAIHSLTAALEPGGWRDIGRGPGSAEGEFVDWLTIRDQAESVRADVRRIRAHPLVSPAISLSGYIYDVRTGRLAEVSGAAAPGVPLAPPPDT